MNIEEWDKIVKYCNKCNLSQIKFNERQQIERNEADLNVCPIIIKLSSTSKMQLLQSKYS